MPRELIICTDLDRTLIANGKAQESPGARARFDALVSRPEIRLAYVSGRHLELVRQAMEDFQLPVPDFIIADVGGSIYHREAGGAWNSLTTWQADIARDWGTRQASDLHIHLEDLSELRLQEESKQGRYKLSYYFPATSDAESLAERARLQLATAGIGTRVIHSIDETREIGLLDIVPERVSKLHAIEALVEMLQTDIGNIVFSGDSGNDLEVLVSAIPSVLVANASEEVKSRAARLARSGGTSKALYIASGGFLGMNGCYSAGILEGVAHFHPHAVQWMHRAEQAQE